MKKEPPAKIKIVIVDDHPVVVDSWMDAINGQKDMKAVAAATDGEKAVELARSLKPDIVLMDYGLPGLQGDEATQSIKKANPGIKVIVVSGHDDEFHMIQAYRSGANAYVTKGTPTREILEVMRRLQAQDCVIPDQAAPSVLHMLRESRKAGAQGWNAELTPVQIDLLNYLKEGYEYPEIAEKMKISLRTVKGYMERILQELGAHNKTHAVVLACRGRHIPLEAVFIRNSP